MEATGSCHGDVDAVLPRPRPAGTRPSRPAWSRRRGPAVRRDWTDGLPRWEDRPIDRRHGHHDGSSAEPAGPDAAAAAAALRNDVGPALRAAVDDLERALPAAPTAEHPIVDEARELLVALDGLDAITRDGGTVTPALVERLLRDARDRCEGALALAAESLQQVDRGRRLIADAREARSRRGEGRSGTPG